MATLLDIPVLSAEISPADGADGRVGIDFAAWLDSHHIEECEYPRRHSEAAMMAYFAGPAAEFLFAPTPDLDGGMDFERAMAIASEYEDPPALHHYVNYLWMKAGHILGRPGSWSTVAALATALVRKGRLDSAEIRRICGRTRTGTSPVGSIEFIELTVNVFCNDTDAKHLDVGARLCERAARSRFPRT